MDIDARNLDALRGEDEDALKELKHFLFKETVRIILKSSPSGFMILIALRNGESAGSISFSNAFGLSKEYIIPCENPQNSAIS